MTKESWGVWILGRKLDIGEKFGKVYENENFEKRKFMVKK